MNSIISYSTPNIN